MLISGDDFRGHIAWRAWGIFLIFGGINSGYSHISQSEISFGIEDKIFWFDVSVYDIVLM